MTRPGAAEYARLSFNGTMDASETRRFVLLDGKRAPELIYSTTANFAACPPFSQSGAAPGWKTSPLSSIIH